MPSPGAPPPTIFGRMLSALLGDLPRRAGVATLAARARVSAPVLGAALDGGVLPPVGVAVRICRGLVRDAAAGEALLAVYHLEAAKRSPPPVLRRRIGDMAEAAAPPAAVQRRRRGIYTCPRCKIPTTLKRLGGAKRSGYHVVTTCCGTGWRLLNRQLTPWESRRRPSA